MECWLFKIYQVGKKKDVLKVYSKKERVHSQSRGGHFK